MRLSQEKVIVKCLYSFDAVFAITIQADCRESIKSDYIMLHNIEVFLFPININSAEKNCETDIVLTEKLLWVLFLKSVFNII